MNRTFENWTKSNEIEHHTFSEFDFRTNRIQSNKSNSIELNQSDCVRFGNRTQSNTIKWISFVGSGEPIQSKPKASPKQARQSKFFLRFFYYLFNNTNPIYKLSMAVKRTCRTEQNKAIIIPAGVFRNCRTLSFFKLTYNSGKTTRRITFMQKSKQITNRDTGYGIK